MKSRDLNNRQFQHPIRRLWIGNKGYHNLTSIQFHIQGIELFWKENGHLFEGI